MSATWKSIPVRGSEITPYARYLSRREFLKAVGIAGGVGLSAGCGAGVEEAGVPEEEAVLESKFDELGDVTTSYEEITHYNNYYEFSTNKEAVAKLCGDFKPLPWTVEVSGLVNKPKVYDFDDLLTRFTQEERVYRLRCVEGWSMVIPWTGFTLASLLKEAEPTADAKFVRFETVSRYEEMKGQGNRRFPWPYQEGLRLDEALNELTILATGLYGLPMPTQNGAPIRLVVPWKYGFKSAKAIVKIELTAERPSTFWAETSPKEYGFYSNVNPNHPHPRWSQASERRIGELQRRPTLMFNGYAEQVAHLYADMDLDAFY